MKKILTFLILMLLLTMSASAEVINFSVTVPTTLPVAVNNNGVVSSATNAKIVNNSTHKVSVRKVTYSAQNSWSLTPYTNNMSTEKVNSKKIGFTLNSLSTTQNGASQQYTPAWGINKSSSLALSYGARVPATTAAYNTTPMKVTFVVEFATRPDGGPDKKTEYGELIDNQKEGVFWAWHASTSTLTFTNDGRDTSATYGAVTDSGEWDDSLTASNTGAWAQYRSLLTHVVVLDTIKPKNTHHWFYNAKLLTGIEGLYKIDTSIVVSMSSMFTACMQLTSLDLSSWDVSKVTNTSDMFSGCVGLQTLYLDNWDPKCLKTTNSMFMSCSNLTTIYAKDWTKYIDIGSASYVFGECEKLPDWTNSKTSGAYCKPTTSGGYFNLPIQAKVDEVYYAWHASTRILTLTNDGRDTSDYGSVTSNGKVINGNIIPWRDYNIKTVIILNEIIPSGMSYWFNYKSSLDTFVGAEKIDTSKCTSMYFTFTRCSSLTSIPGTGKWNLNNVGLADSMFSGCSSLTYLDASGWGMSKCTQFKDMFSNCASLTTLDLRSWDLSSGSPTISYMFYNCAKLRYIYCSNAWSENYHIRATSNVFTGCTSLPYFNPSNISGAYCKLSTSNGYFTYPPWRP